MTRSSEHWLTQQGQTGRLSPPPFQTYSDSNRKEGAKRKMRHFCAHPGYPSDFPDFHGVSSPPDSRCGGEEAQFWTDFRLIAGDLVRNRPVRAAPMLLIRGPIILTSGVVVLKFVTLAISSAERISEPESH
jgi:hypothetical protein